MYIIYTDANLRFHTTLCNYLPHARALSNHIVNDVLPAIITGMHYINAHSGDTHKDNEMCCKEGIELELMFSKDNEKFE